jgi:hypothetical protein
VPPQVQVLGVNWGPQHLALPARVDEAEDLEAGDPAARLHVSVLLAESVLRVARRDVGETVGRTGRDLVQGRTTTPPLPPHSQRGSGARTQNVLDEPQIVKGC